MMDKTVDFSKPDTLHIDKQQRKIYLKEVGVLSTSSLKSIASTKIPKHQTLRQRN